MGHHPQFWDPAERRPHRLREPPVGRSRSAAGEKGLAGDSLARLGAPVRSHSTERLLQRGPDLVLRNCGDIPDNYMGFGPSGSSRAREALPPPSASAAVPSADHVCGRAHGRSVQENFVNKVVARCGPAVVRVDTERQRPAHTQLEAEIFSFFFGVRPDQSPADRKVEGHGSGFCVEPSGIILTNAHVVQGQERIFVTFPDGLRLEAVVLGADEVIDLAALQVAPQGRTLPCIPLGSSDGLRVGDWAIACGNPFGLNNSCTLGIISSLDRSTGEAGWDWMRHPLLQTDAAVNQGNSGGPLLNENGEVIGVVSMRALFGEGIAFAIPIDSIKRCLHPLLRRKDVPHAYLGMKLGPAPEGKRGVAVQMVLDGTPADKAGLQRGDTVEEMNGQSLRSTEDLQRVVRKMSPGDSAELKVRRDGKSSKVPLVAGNVKKLKELKEQARERRAGQKGPQRTFVIIPD
mmetsp:Transcript_24345/g.72558  ORF Transcript_24345/g.72558 Transcript_24345/m.72558 type:complete len:460 (+) Transcript_24345:3-1382(+)